MDRSKTARYWRYDGNHHAGRNHERHDPHGFGLPLICAMADWGEGPHFLGLPLREPMTLEDARMIRVVHHKPDSSFGHEITVSAPASVWEKGRQALARLCAEL